jgi:uncharacterized protein (TIGR00251 family)
VVKPNARETRILEQDDGAMTVAIAAPPEDNKANIELVKFLSRKLKKQVRIASGFGSKMKMLEIID